MVRLLLLLLMLAVPAGASAQSVQDQIIDQLAGQGFTRIEVSRTLLGRVRLRALSATLDRELIFNPATGEILRDSWQQRRSDRAVVPRLSDPDDGRSGGQGTTRSSGSDDG